MTRSQITEMVECALFQFDVPAYKTSDNDRRLTKKDVHAIVWQVVDALNLSKNPGRTAPS